MNNKNIEPILTNQYGVNILDKGQEEKLLFILDELAEAIFEKRIEVKNKINNILDLKK